MINLKKWVMSLSLLSSTIFVLAACGGGGGSSPTPAETPGVSYAISGTVTSSGAQLAGVTMSLVSSSGTVTMSTSATGAYSFSNIANGNYTVAPSLAGYLFNPVSLTVTVNNANVTGKNFAATASTASTHSVSGTIGGAVAKNVMITLSGAATGSAFTDENGNYTFSGLVAGTYIVTPSLAGYAFSSSGTITISAADSTQNNFVSTVAPSASSLIFIPATSLPDATTGTTYSRSVVGSTSGGTPPYHYQSDSFLTGAPPLGMIVDLNGNLTGTPSVVGTYTFGVCAVDLAGASSCGTTTISVISVTTFSGSFSGSGSFSRVFPGFTTCTFSNSFTGTITVTMTTQADGTSSSSAHVAGNFVSTATAGDTLDFDCLDTNLTWDNVLDTSGALPTIAWSDVFFTPGGSTVTGAFTGTLSGNTITGTQVETIDTSTGSASIPVTLTKQ